MPGVTKVLPGPRSRAMTSYDDETLFSAIMAGAACYAGWPPASPRETRPSPSRSWTGPAEDPALAPLTSQERRTLELIGQGMTNRQISEEMFLAEKVKNYISSSLLAKLGLERRTQAAVFAAKHLDTWVAALMSSG